MPIKLNGLIYPSVKWEWAFILELFLQRRNTRDPFDDTVGHHYNNVCGESALSIMSSREKHSVIGLSILKPQ